MEWTLRVTDAFKHKKDLVIVTPKNVHTSASIMRKIVIMSLKILAEKQHCASLGQT